MTGLAEMDIKLRFVHVDVDRYGHERLYFRRAKGQPKVRIREAPGTPGFYDRYHQLLALSEAGTLVISTKKDLAPAEGTWRWLCTRYFASVDCQRMDHRSQRVQRSRLEKTFGEPIAPGRGETFADFPINRMTSKAVRVLRDRVSSSTPESANNRVKAIRRVFAWGVENDLVKANVARDVKIISTGSQGFHAWTDIEVSQFEARHPIGTKARLALTLLLLTGTRRSDVVHLGRQHVRAGWLKFTQHKNRNRRPVTIEIPVLPELQRVIDASETGDLAFLVTQYGKPFTAAGFGNWFRDRCNEAGLPHCSAHGLRKAGATRAAENGATPHELMAIFGWRTLKQAELYTRTAERKRLAGGAIGLLQRTKNGTKVPHSGRG